MLNYRLDIRRLSSQSIDSFPHTLDRFANSPLALSCQQVPGIGQYQALYCCDRDPDLDDQESAELIRVHGPGPT